MDREGHRTDEGCDDVGRLVTVCIDEESDGKLGDEAKCSCFTIGAKIEFVPSENISFFILPEYAVATKKEKAYELIADRLKFTPGGIFGTAGLIIKF